MAVTILRKMHERDYHIIWSGPYHVIVPATEMTGKVLCKMTINHKCNRLFHFCTKDMCFSCCLVNQASNILIINVNHNCLYTFTRVYIHEGAFLISRQYRQ